MERRFPKAGADGSFKVRVRFNAAPEKDIASIQRWVSEWVETHGEWFFLGQSHRFADYFADVPRASVDTTGALTLVLAGVSADRRFWKDWYARLGRDMIEAFPELGGLASVEDCD
jgi:hypothetical protein